MARLPGRLAEIGLIGGLLLGSAAVGGFAFVAKAHSHDWYPVECCSANDCAPLPDGEVKLTPQGWPWTNGDGSRLFPFDHADTRPSPDGQFHGCQLPYTKKKRCLFVVGGTS